MPSRTYVQMYVETGLYNYIVKDRLHYMYMLMDACQYLDNHPEKVEEVVMQRVRVGKFTRGERRTYFQWLFLELQIINSWIWDEQFSGDTMCVVPGQNQLQRLAPSLIPMHQIRFMFQNIFSIERREGNDNEN